MRTLDIGKNLFYHYQHMMKIEGYYGLLAYWALAEIAAEDGDEQLLEHVRQYINAYPGFAVGTYYNFQSYRCGGNARAWLAWKGLFHGQEEILEEYARKMMEAPVDRNGILCAPSAPELEKVWIDVVYPTTPFMIYTGLLLNRKEYCDFGIKQCFALFDLLMDEEVGLLHQCRGFMQEPSKISEDHWSRGNGWGMIGLADILNAMPQDSQEYIEAAVRMKRFVDSLLNYQTKRGLWRQEITEPLAYEESSGTALILYGIGVAIRQGVLSDEHIIGAYRKGIQGMCEWFIKKNYSIIHCCPGCLCPGEGETKGTIQAYVSEKVPPIDEVHSFGCVMLALVEAHRNGIIDIEWEEKKFG